MDISENVYAAIGRLEAWAKGLAEGGAPHQVPLGKDGLDIIAHVRELHGAVGTADQNLKKQLDGATAREFALAGKITELQHALDDANAKLANYGVGSKTSATEPANASSATTHSLGSASQSA